MFSFLKMETTIYIIVKILREKILFLQMLLLIMFTIEIAIIVPIVLEVGNRS